MRCLDADVDSQLGDALGGAVVGDDVESGL